MRSADDPAENIGPLATLLYGVSITYCMTTSLAQGGAGLGTCGLPAARLRELSARAGFTAVTTIDVEDPFNALYVVRRMSSPLLPAPSSRRRSSAPARSRRASSSTPPCSPATSSTAT